MASTFQERLAVAQRRSASTLCVGLDPDPELLPEPFLSGQDTAGNVVAFCRAIVEATSPFASSYKVNFAFFEALGDAGIGALRQVRRSIPDAIPVIADAKRGDIGNTARFYARSVFDDLGFDAVTLSPYMGADSILPFAEYPDRGVFVLARTSNPGAADFQHLVTGDAPLYLHVARAAVRWQAQSAGTIGLVVGATASAALTELRAACGSMPFLVPGIGAQGGDAATVMAAAYAGPGTVLVNSSRAILYASRGADFQAAAALAARESSAALGFVP